ncbi:MAG: hypothetical protein ACOH2J_18200 [Allorhizobium sp.]
MQILAFLAVLAAFGFILWNLFGVVFASGRRRRKLKLSGLGVIILFATLAFFVHVSDQLARDAGFDDMADSTAAEKAGITDPSSWQAQKTEGRRLVAEQQAGERAAVEKLAQLAAEKQAAQDQAEKAEHSAAEAKLQQARSEAKAKENAERAAAEAKEEAARAEADAKEEAVRAEAEAKEEAERKEVEIAEAAADKAKADKCRQDLQCWAEDAFVSASFDCTVAIQSLAKFDYEWTDGWTEPKLSRYRWSNKTTGIVTYLGDKIKFQNGFGAWKHMTYSCDYDPTSKTVINAEAY